MAIHYENIKYESVDDIISSSGITCPYVVNIDHNLVIVEGWLSDSKIKLICYKYLDYNILLDIIKE
jgi:hypothetical protein